MTSNSIMSGIFCENENNESCCAICRNTYEETHTPYDGPSNSDIPTRCRHFLCVECWEQVYKVGLDDSGTYKCPFCREDITSWICSHYQIEDEEEDDEEEEENE